MSVNVGLGILLLSIGIGLWFLSRKKIIGNETLDTLEKVASIIAVVAAILLLMFPLLSQSPEATPTAATEIVNSEPTSLAPDNIPTESANPNLIDVEGDSPPTTGIIGSQWTRPKDNMTMVHVPAGSFMMGAIDGDPEAESDELPRHEVSLSNFWIDSTEVTNNQYADFLNKNGNLLDEGLSWYAEGNEEAEIEFRNGKFVSLEGFEKRPVVFVSWYGADAYCQWAGGDLPTEAQWEYAARGTDSNRFPWGNELPSSIRLNFNNNIGHTTDVGQFPEGKSWVGAFDLAGNVIEWVNDWYYSKYYENSPTENPQGQSTGLIKVIRGGSWEDSAQYQRSSWRNYIDKPSFRVENVGFRCVINLQE